MQPAVLTRTKSKGPVVRCVSAERSFEVGNVDSVDKVYRVLTKHMKVEVCTVDGCVCHVLNVSFLQQRRRPFYIQGVSTKVCDCLKWKYRANSHLENGKVSLAIDAYDKAIATGVEQQEGVLLLMRATAYLKRAADHKENLKKSVTELVKVVPDQAILQNAIEEGAAHPALASSVFRRVVEDAASQQKQFRRTQYRHGLYQHALLHAAQDSLRATQLLPQYATSWLRAGEILSELWKLKESTQYYERAMALDDSLASTVGPIISKLRTRQDLLDSARAYGWSEDTLRLALDVSG